MCAFSASRFFACLKTTPPFENDLADKTHHCALRRNSVSPQDRFLEAWFSLFLRADTFCSCKEKSRKIKNLLQGIRTAWSPRHAFRPRSCDKSHLFGKLARQVLEVTASKISIFNAFIGLLIFTKSGSPFFFGCSVTLPATFAMRRFAAV